VAIYLKPGMDAEVVKTELVKKLDGRGFVAIFTNTGLREEVLRIFDSTFAITWALELIAILVAMAGVAATMMTLVLERKDEIRLLRIAGAEASQIRRTIMIESGILGAVSQGLGLLVGLILSLVLIHVINPQSFGWSIQFYTPWLFLRGATLLTILGTMLAGLWPARRSVVGGFIGLTIFGLCSLAQGQEPPSSPAVSQTWKPALPGYTYEFPRDHGQHLEHKIEWWYFTGNLQTQKGRRFGYQLTFFRIGAEMQPVVKSPWALRDVWMAHFAITDVQATEYHHADRLNRAGPGIAGATEKRVWNEDWFCTISPPEKVNPAGAFVLQAADRDFALQLSLDAGKPVVIHGSDGISQKGVTAGNASHYYSLTRMPSQGTVRIGEETFEVTGQSWMDHEFGTSFLEKGTVGWDWFSGQLSDGSELMLFQLRGDSDKDSSAGTLIRPDGSTEALKAGDFTLLPGEIWKSPNGAAYPIQWQIKVPSQGIVLTSQAVLPNQEFRSEATPGLGYWEGAVDYSGTIQGREVKGQGYLEMTGYSGQAMSVWFGQKP
ncbi:MAG: FtsX-like permease family protein, partial [Prosthecobacter sp.]|nr:FtsX-like permease family protein [Prosthecobacter sp.]